MDRKVKSGIYTITAPSGSRYVGSAVDFRNRWRQHRHELRKGNHHNQPLQRACVKYGIESLVFSKLLICRPSDLLMFEQLAIDSLKPEYNASPVAGSQLGFRHTAESKLKNSLAKRGKKQSPETCRKRAEAMIGRLVSAETRAKISAANSGKVRSIEVRKRIAANRTGKSLSLAARAKLSAFWKGRKFGHIPLQDGA
jgi:group I intron endonuclease